MTTKVLKKFNSNDIPLNPLSEARREKEFATIQYFADQYPLAWLCEALGVTRAGYSSWLNRQPSKREIENRQLMEQIKEIHEASGQTYGYNRMTKYLNEELNAGVNKKRVRRLMRLIGIQGKSGPGKVSSNNKLSD